MKSGSNGLKRLTKIGIEGDFPIVLHIDEDCLPISEKELTDLLEENNPVTFTGQRTPIYELPGGLGLYLRAKGFDYRASVYPEIKEYVLDNHEMLTIERAKELGLAMGNFKRPFAKRFKESSGHFQRQVPQPDGSFKKQWTSPRPYAAMTLDRAVNEYEQTVWARENGFNVDIALGYAEFPGLNFKANGKKVKCGGFLALIPTAFDLRFIEILYHLPHSEEIQKIYGVYGKETDNILLYFIKSVGSALSSWHKERRTLSYIHPMNVKWGLVRDDMKPKMWDERGNPVVTLCDLDAVEHEANKSDSVFLANAAEDLDRFLGLIHTPFLTSKISGSILDKLSEDDQKVLFDLTIRMRDQSHLKPPTNIVQNYAMAGYFGVDPANHFIPFLSTSLFARNKDKGVNITEQKDDFFLRMLRKKYDL
jgi:hypothetical protein